MSAAESFAIPAPVVNPAEAALFADHQAYCSWRNANPTASFDHDQPDPRWPGGQRRNGGATG